MVRLFSWSVEPEDPRGPPSWTGGSEGTRVLVEHRHRQTREVLKRRLEANGYQAVTCPGPVGDTSCPLLRQEHCPAVDGADVIVSGLDFWRDANRLIAAAITRTRPDTPLLLDCPDHVVDDWGGTGTGLENLHRINAPKLIRRLDELAGPTAET